MRNVECRMQSAAQGEYGESAQGGGGGVGPGALGMSCFHPPLFAPVSD